MLIYIYKKYEKNQRLQQNNLRITWFHDQNKSVLSF